MIAPSAAAALVVEHLNSRPPTLGAGKLLCIDGPSGAGKTTLAEQVARLVPATVVHTDQLCPGWDGLPAVPGMLADLLVPLTGGRPGRYRAWDWHTGRPGETVEVEATPVLVLEGVGAGARAIATWTTTLVWLDADPGQRKTRALERDGASFRDRWAGWAVSEDTYFAAEQVGERADLSFRTG